MYTIGQLAKAAEVNVETIRYYEKQLLIDRPKKPIQGYRQYAEETLARINFIKCAKHLGFTLSEIATLIKLSDGNCSDIKILAERKLTSVQQKIEDLKCLEESLKVLIDGCRGNPDEAKCPIIESLAQKQQTLDTVP